MRDMARPSGYDYTYRFSVDDEIIPLYELCLCLAENKGNDQLMSYLFEIRANFKLKRINGNGEIMMGSERFGAAVRENDDEWFLEDGVSFRLKNDYWMSDDEIQSLVRDALGFADGQRAAAAPPQAVVPVVVELDVWTVQREGEPFVDAIDRAIRPQKLIPIYLWPYAPAGSGDGHKFRPDSLSFLRMLRRNRADAMKVCPICWRKSGEGDQVSALPCRHACHSLCVFELLESDDRGRCPLCGFLIPLVFKPLSAEEIEDMLSG